jgi:hypothetical protein
LRYGFLFLELIILTICFCYSNFYCCFVWTYSRVTSS